MIRVRGTARGTPYPKVDGYTTIPAWSRGAKPWRELSPFEVGGFDYAGVRVHLFENFWQGLKVYKKVEKQNKKEWAYPAEVHVDEGTGEPNQAWHQWSKALLQHTLPVRRPNGRNIPEYTWFNGEKLDLIAARKRVYIPYYQRLLRAHPVYQQLLALFRVGKNLIIVEPDGPCPETYPDGMPVTLERLIELQEVTVREENGRYHPYGHGYVIALTLLEDVAGEQAVAKRPRLTTTPFHK